MLARNHKLFTIYKQKTRGGAQMWYARFYNKETGRYQVARSLSILVEGKQERKPEAYEAARAMLAEIDFKPKEKASELLVDYLRDFWGEGSQIPESYQAGSGRPARRHLCEIAH
jgi:hypothetical protein